MADVLIGIALSAVGAITFFLTGIPLLFIAEPTLAGITLWEILDVLTNIVAPLVGALIAVIIWLHRRVSSLEEAKSQQEASLYGIQGDTLSKGVTAELRQLRNELEDFRNNFDERLDKLDNRTDELDTRTDILEEESDD